MTKKSQYIPESPDQYKGEQIILTSGRVLLNAKSDSILMFSKQSIGFSSAGTLNFDSDDKCIINSPKIYLGLNASEPMLLGNQTVDMLKDLLTQLHLLSDALSKLTVYIGGEEVPNTNIGTPAQDLSNKIKQLLSQIDNIKSKNNFTI